MVQPWYLAFLASLRRSYKRSSVRLMDSLVEWLHKNVTQIVDKALVRVFAHWHLMVGLDRNTCHV